MVFNQTDKCHLTKQSEVVMMHSTLSSPKPEPENTYQDAFSSIWNQPSSMKLEPVPTDNCSTQNNWSPVKKMPPITSPEDIILLVKKSLTFAWTESENSLIIVPDFKDLWSSTQSEVVPDQDSDLFYSKDFQSIMVKNPNSVLQFTHPHKSQLPLLNHTTQFCPLTLC